MKAYVIGVGSKTIFCTDMFWYDEHNSYYSNSPEKQISPHPELTSIEKERLALLKLSPQRTSIKGVGRFEYNRYYVAKEHQE